MTSEASQARWRIAAIVIARLIFALVFIMAVSFKLMNIDGTAAYIAAVGFPMSTLLAWLAALLELALIACFVTGAFFSEAALVAAAYVLLLVPHIVSWFPGRKAFLVQGMQPLAGLLLFYAVVTLGVKAMRWLPLAGSTNKGERPLVRAAG